MFNLEKYMADRRASLEKELQKSETQARNSISAFDALKAAGFDPGELTDWRTQWPTFSVNNPKDFKAIHQALGGLENGGVLPCGDGRNRKVEVVLRPKNPDFKHFTFYFKKQLPKGKDAKCKIVTVTRREKVLVCDK